MGKDSESQSSVRAYPSQWNLLLFALFPRSVVFCSRKSTAAHSIYNAIEEDAVSHVFGRRGRGDVTTQKNIDRGGTHEDWAKGKLPKQTASLGCRIVISLYIVGRPFADEQNFHSLIMEWSGVETITIHFTLECRLHDAWIYMGVYECVCVMWWCL